MKKLCILIICVALFLLPGCEGDAPQQPKIVKKAPAAAQNSQEQADKATPTESSDPRQSQAPSPGKKQQENVLTIGVMDEYFPYVRMLPGQEPEGFDVDVLREIMDRTKLPYKFVSVKWNKALQDLKIGDLSMLMIMAITPERSQIYTFPESYAKYEVSLFERRDAENKIKASTPEDLITALHNRNICIPTGYSAHEELRQYKEIKIVTAPDDYACITMLTEGDVDAIALDKVRGLFHIKKNDLPLALVEPSLTEHPYSTGIHKGISQDVIEKYNAALQAMISDGSYDKYLEKWFAIEAKNTPPASTPKKKLKIGVMDDFYPYIRMQPGGEPEGFDAEVLRHILKQAGLEHEFVSITWHKALQDLKIGTLDMIPIAAITPERLKVYEFTDSYVVYEVAITTRRENSSIGGDSPEDVLKSLYGKKVGVTAGYSTIELLRPHKEIEIITAPDYEATFQLLLDNKVDAMANDKLMSLWYIKEKNLPLKVIDPVLKRQHSATMAYRDIDQHIIKQYNSALRSIKKNGVFQSIYEKWFGAADSSSLKALKAD